jgi:catechol 2,3-dioxygenase-like lactoylglutathione lyase family enzyme
VIGYVTVGTSDLARAALFYDALLAEFGARRFMETPEFIAWSAGKGTAAFFVTKPHDKAAASVGNGTMVALYCPTKEMVDRVHAKAMSLGAVDEGPAGPRGDTFYAGYFRDLDGNKLNAFCSG